MNVPAYPKISGPFRRATEGPSKGRVKYGEWMQDEFAYLNRNIWIFTEKVDGMNIRIGWDGYKTGFAGRTDRAMLPAQLVEHLNENFTEELFEQSFGGQEVALYGEGFGPGIQGAGAAYGGNQRFVLFDVLINGRWLERHEVDGVAKSLGIFSVPTLVVGDIHEAINEVRAGLWSDISDCPAEGLIGVPLVPLRDARGGRVMVKVKDADFGPGKEYAA